MSQFEKLYCDILDFHHKKRKLEIFVATNYSIDQKYVIMKFVIKTLSVSWFCD